MQIFERFEVKEIILNKVKVILFKLFLELRVITIKWKNCRFSQEHSWKVVYYGYIFLVLICIIARSDFNEQRGYDLFTKFYTNKDVALQSETYVTLTCLSALSLHLEIHHKCNLESNQLKISHFKNTSRLYLDR